MLIQKGGCLLSSWWTRNFQNKHGDGSNQRTEDSLEADYLGLCIVAKALLDHKLA